MELKEQLNKIKYNTDEYYSLPQEDRIEWLSWKIFNKPSSELKYLYVTNYIHKQLLEEDLTRTGLYQWLNVFNGDILYPRDVEDYSHYDIIQINMSSQDLHMISMIKDKLGTNAKTKLVLNNDYTTEMWQTSFPHPYILHKLISEYPDMIFGTEYYQTTALSAVTGRKCFVIPHPADVKRLKNLPKRQVKDVISVIWRRYDNFSYLPSMIVSNLGYNTRLIGYDKNMDPKSWVTTTMFDKVCAGTNFFDFCDQLRESKVVYDPFTFHSYNRAIVDCAAMGVPVVGSNRTQSINVCYPFTKVDPYDVASSKKLIEALLTNEDFRNKVISYAQEHVEVYNHINSKEKYLSALYESINEKQLLEESKK